jgi:hypothetical protein
MAENIAEAAIDFGVALKTLERPLIASRALQDSRV